MAKTPESFGAPRGGSSDMPRGTAAYRTGPSNMPKPAGGYRTPTRAQSGAPLQKGVKGKEAALNSMEPAAKRMALGKAAQRARNKKFGVPPNAGMDPEVLSLGSVKKSKFGSQYNRLGKMN